MNGATGLKAGFGAGFALLLGICYSAIQETRQFEQSAQALGRATQVMKRLEDLSVQSIEGEAAARRFIAAPDMANAARCREKLGRALDLARELEVLIPGQGSQHENLQAVKRLITRQAETTLRSLPPPTASAKAAAAHTREVQAALAALDSAGTSASLRSSILSIEGEATQTLSEHTVRQQMTAVVSRALFFTASTLSAALFLFVGWRIAAEQKNRNKARRKLRAKEEEYQRVVELAGDIICRTDTEGRFTLCNQAALNLLHFSEAEVIGRSWLRFVRQDKRTAAARFYRRQIGRGLKSTYYEMPLVDGHGGERWVALNVQLVIENGRTTGLQAIARDVTGRRQTEAERQRSRNFVERVTAAAPGVLYVYDLVERRNVFCNREVISLLGYKPADIPDMTTLPKQFYHPDDQAMIEAQRAMLQNLSDGEIRRLEYRMRHASGHWIWLSVQETPFERGSDGLVKQILGISLEIGGKGTLEKCQRPAEVDVLTGLRTRQYFWNGLHAMLRRTSLDHLGSSLCLFKLENFQEINDRFGAAAGEEVLETVGNILRAELRTTDLAGRLAENQFCFVLPCTTSEECTRVAERIRHRLSTLAFGLRAGTPFSVTATFGVAESDPDVNAKELMEAADRALSRAKAEGRNRVMVETA